VPTRTIVTARSDSDDAIQIFCEASGLLRSAGNDEVGSIVGTRLW